MTDEEMLAMSKMRDPDCNGNGILDGLDIQQGFARDLNHNGEIDECEWDHSGLPRLLTGNRWWELADVADTSYFSVVHTYVSPIVIRYTVPPAGASVELTVHDSTGAQVAMLVGENQVTGPYMVQWDRKTREGVRLPAGTYLFRLQVDRHRLEQRMGWKNLL